MYFPTDKIETYRLLAILGDLQLDYMQERYLKEYVFSKEEYNELFIQSADSSVPMKFIIYDKWLKEKKYDYIKSYFTIKFGSKGNNTNGNDNFPITICDPFAGESKWIDIFKSFVPKNDYGSDILLISNELEQNRYEIFKDNVNIDEKYNKSFEELNLPKNSLSLILFNCPYGETNKIRNVKNYINQILEKQILFNPTNTKDYKTGYIVFVIRKDDFLDSLDILC